MTEEGWEILSSSGGSSLSLEHWTLGRLLEFANHPSVDLHLHTVRRRRDGAVTLALMVRPADLDVVPRPFTEAIATTDADLIPLAIVTGSPTSFFEEWEDLGRLPQK